MRAAKRKDAKVRFLLQVIKEKTIGVDPIFDHSRGRSDFARREMQANFLKRSKEYEERKAG